MDSLMVEVGGRRFSGGADGHMWLLPDALLEGWWDSPETLFDDDPIPGQDGSFDPEDVTLGPRRVNFNALIESSTSEWAEHDVRTWAAALAKQTDIGFRVWHEGRWLSLRNAKIRGTARVRPHRRFLRRTEVQFTVWAADPRKYGDMAPPIYLDALVEPSGGLVFPVVRGAMDFGAEGLAAFPGVFSITNPGTADIFPTFTVTGPLNGFTIATDENVIEYDAAIPRGASLVLSPYLGGRAVLNSVDVSTNLTQADWAPVGPGQTRNYLFTADTPQPGSQLIVTHPKGAWI